MFPAEALGPKTLSALRSVFPKETKFLPVGGIAPENLASYVAAGAAGFGLGSSLYRPGISVGEVSANARSFRRRLARLRTKKLIGVCGGTMPRL